MFSINNFYCDIVNSLTSARLSIVPQSVSKSKHSVPGWNDHVKLAHSEARQAFILWRNCSKPRHGDIFKNMQSTRANFKYAVDFCIYILKEIVDYYRSHGSPMFFCFMDASKALIA